MFDIGDGLRPARRATFYRYWLTATTCRATVHAARVAHGAAAGIAAMSSRPWRTSAGAELDAPQGDSMKPSDHSCHLVASLAVACQPPPAPILDRAIL